MKKLNVPADEAASAAEGSASVSRPNAITGIAAATAVNVAASVAAKSVGERQEGQRANVAEVSGARGDYSVVHSDHYVPNSADIVAHVDALMLEQRMLYSEEGVKMYFDWMATSNDPDARQYRDVLQGARKMRKPVFFIDQDIGNSGDVPQQEQLTKNVIRTIESALGVSLVGFTAGAALHQGRSGMTRREFLKHAFRGVAAGYLLLPRAQVLASSMAGSPPNEASFSRRAYRALDDVNAVVHPELRLHHSIEHRNVIMAQNAEAASDILAKELGRKPKSAVFVGAHHIGIEREIRSDASRREQKIRSERIAHSGMIARVDFEESSDGDHMKISIVRDPAFTVAGSGD